MDDVVIGHELIGIANDLQRIAPLTFNVMLVFLGGYALAWFSRRGEIRLLRDVVEWVRSGTVRSPSP